MRIPQKIHIWVDILNNKIVGTAIINENLTGDIVTNLLRNKLLSTVQTLEDQLDGASSHYAVQIAHRGH